MRIAILGTRGIPAHYGGFETFAEEFSVRMAARGHDVTVYCRPRQGQQRLALFKGVRRVELPTLRRKYLDTPVHTWLSSLHAMTQRFEVCLYCNAANAVFLPLPRLMGAKTLINVDGLEWQRRKWSILGRWMYRFSESAACALSHGVIADARVIQDYYRQRHGCESTFIPYGAPSQQLPSTEALHALGVQPGRYFFYVGRLEPENNADRLLAAFQRLETDFKLVLVGDAPYAQEYIQRLKSTTDPRIIFTGYLFGRPCHELLSHAYCTVHATEVGGTHPALLEAMGLGNGVVCSDVPENREVARDSVIYFSLADPDDLLKKLQLVLQQPNLLQTLASQARQIVQAHYDWESVTDAYEQLFLRVLEGCNARL